MSTFTENVCITATLGSETGYGRLGGYMKLSRPGIPSRLFGLTIYDVVKAGGLSAVHNVHVVKNAAAE